MDPQSEIRTVSIEEIVPSPYQPRATFSEKEISELAESIQNVGMIHPPVVRALPGSNKYELVAGERRLRASQYLGLKEVVVVVTPFKADISAQATLIENIQRVNLNPMEISRGMKRLIEGFNYSQSEVAQKTGKKRSTVANYLRLLNLPKNIQEGIERGRLSMGHAKVILSVEGVTGKSLLYKRIVDEALTVRKAEEAAAEMVHPKGNDNRKDKGKKERVGSVRSADVHLKDLEEKLQQFLGMPITLKAKKSGGTIQIDYFDLNDLDRFLSTMAFSLESD
jgi:ParB family chromosome partitioning protein